MNRLIMLAALMLSLVGGLWVMSGSVPVAAQTTPSANRSFSSATVAPDGQLTVMIAAADYGGFGAVTETLPAGFTYVSLSDDGSGDIDVLETGQNVRFVLRGVESFSYMVTASSTEGTYLFSGSLRDGDRNDHTVGGDMEVTVEAGATTPDPTPGAIVVDPIQFDVVPDKAVKGALVSGLGKPIGGDNQLEWDVTGEDTGLDASATVVGTFDGKVGDFEVKHEGSGKFRLYVATSGAPNLSRTQSISVEVTLDPDGDVEDDNVVVNLTGSIVEQQPLAFTNASFSYTIPQGISDNDEDTLIGSFTVTGGIDDEDEYLDGILSGDGSDLFAVNDSDMTLMYRGDADALEDKTYNLKLTVSGDAGLANRTAIADVTIIVTASNMAPTAPTT